MKDLCEKIRTMRKKKGLSQRELAAKTGFSERAIQSWESGKRLPGYDGLLALADVLNVSTDWLLGRANDDGN